MNEDAWAREIARLEELAAGAAGDMAFPLLAEVQRRAGRPEAAERVARAGLARSPGVSAGRVALALALLDQKRTAEARAELERLLGGGSEHALAGRVAAAHAPEPEPALAPFAGGELATLDPYPDESPAGPFAREESAAGPFARGGDADAPRESRVFAGEVGDGELDSAFEAAQPERDRMLGADDVAHAALASLPLEEEADEPPAQPSALEGPLELADEEREETPPPGSPFATETVAGLLERQGHPREAERIRANLPQPPAASEPQAPAPPPATRDAAPGPTGRARQATLERWLDNLRRDRR